MLYSIFLILLLSFGLSMAQQNDDFPCTTPNGENATCISLYSCKVIVEAVLNGTTGAREFLTKSQCGFWKNDPKVCCGSKGYFDLPTDLLSIFTKKPSAIETTPTPTTQAPVLLIDYKVKELPDRTVCGLERETNKIINGEIAEIYDFPWMVAIEYVFRERSGESAGIKCGGSIINNRYVLTAAHCLNHLEFKAWKTWLGDWILSTERDCLNGTLNEVCNDPKKVVIEREISHPYYANGNNDIALLKLAEDITYTDFIRPACLPPVNLPNPTVGTNMVAAGWGATDANDVTKSSDIKRKASLPIRPIRNCVSLSDFKRVTSNQLCAGGEQGRDSCQGDSGGPLMRRYEDAGSKVQWYVEGIVSWGEGCGRVGVPAVYTRVSRYVRWIINAISEEER